MCFKKILFSVFCVCFAASLQGQELVWADLEQDAKKHLINLINIDTSQPEGNEINAVRYVYKVLNRHKIDWEIYRPEKNRASISAVIKGSDKTLKPLMLLAHLDTVAPSGTWKYPPIKATEENGRIYGLGSSDAKNFAAIYLTFFTWIKRNNITPKRDIILLLTADEESGSSKGLSWVMNNPRWKKLKPGYAINEGGSVIIEEGSVPLVFVEGATKMYMDIKVTAAGTAGHSSMGAAGNNAVYNLSQALSKIEQLRMPYVLTPVTRSFFEQISHIQNEDGKTTIELLLDGSKSESDMAAEIISGDNFFKTQLQDTITPTIISAGNEVTSTSSEATAVLNCRLLPSTEPDEFVSRITKLFEGDENISIEVLEKPKMPAPPFPGGGDDLFNSIVLSGQEVFEGSITLLGMTPASSDSEFLRREGIITYGIGAPADVREIDGHSHSADEHVELSDFFKHLRFSSSIIYSFAVGGYLSDREAKEAAGEAK